MGPAATIVALSQESLDIRDGLGRHIKIRRLNALDRLRLLKAAGPELSRNDTWLNIAALAVSVIEIDGVPRPTPLSERQIELTVQELGDVGLEEIAGRLDDWSAPSHLPEDNPLGNEVGTSS